jgi:glycosyltransferase involved in cell wall biosynthesis
MNRILFTYQYAFSITGGIETFNKYFISALEEISKAHTEMCVELVGIYDHEKDVKTSLHFQTLDGNKLRAIQCLIANAKKFDTFIFAHVHLAPLACIVKMLNPKARILFCTHGIEVWKKLPKMTEWIMNKSTVLTVSTFSQKELKKYNPKLTDIRIFPNCIKAVKEPASFTNPFNPQHFNILSLTRLDPSEQYKGIHTVISALPLLITAIPNIRYTVIGKGEDRVRLQALTDSLGVAGYVDFLGFVEDIGGYYEHCDVFTLPSKKEGFGIVYLEAMQYKKPVLAVNYGGPTDVIVDSETGFLCEYDDVQCLAAKIKMLYGDPSLSKALGEAGYDRLMERFTFEKFEENLRSILI